MLALVLALSFARAAPVICLDDARAARLVAPFVGTYATGDDVAHAAISYAGGRLRIDRDDDDDGARGRRILDLASDALTAPLETKARDDVLGNHVLSRTCTVGPTHFAFEEIRSTWFKRIVERISLGLSRDGIDLWHTRVLEHRGSLGLGEWVETFDDHLAWAVRHDEYLNFIRLSRTPRAAAECEAGLEDR